MSAPFRYRWSDGCWRPLPYFQKRAEQSFVDGQIALLETVQDRSTASHNQYFAWVQETFDQLPEAMRGRWATPDDLRKWALTYTPFCDREEFKCESKAEAVRWARYLGGSFHRMDVSGTTLYGFRAHSQSRATMSGRKFQESKEAVAGVFAELLGVDVETLKREAGQAA